MHYCKSELKATSEMAEPLIKALQESVEALSNPESKTNEDVLCEWIFVTRLNDAADQGYKLINFGCGLGYALSNHEFTTREEREEFSLSQLPIFINNPKEDKAKSDLIDSFKVFAKSIEEERSKRKQKEEAENA